MVFWNFILNNFVAILLSLGLFVTLFVTKSIKEKKSVIIISILIFVILHIVLDYLKVANEGSNIPDIFIHILVPLTVYFFTLLFCPLNKEFHIIYTIPFVLGALCMLIFKEQYVLVSYITVCAYSLMMIAHSIFYLKNRMLKIDGIVMIISSVMNIMSLIIDYFTSSRGLISSTILLGTLVIFFKDFVKNQNEKASIQEKMIQGQKTSIAISQIQPHFLYNSLATIGYLCKNDPITASKAIDQFSDYLRANLNSLSQMTNVPFNNELKHVQTYLWLEKLRFEERLEVEYDIQVSDFLVPSLSIQPLVENAVKHGICEKIDGGKITIRTVEYFECIKIIIEDNGAGFDTKKKPKDGRVHVGIDNVRSRVQSMADGELEIKSEIGKGTISTITIPRR